MLWVSESFLMGCSKIKINGGRRTVLPKNVIKKEEVLKEKKCTIQLTCQILNDLFSDNQEITVCSSPTVSKNLIKIQAKSFCKLPASSKKHF